MPARLEEAAPPSPVSQRGKAEIQKLLLQCLCIRNDLQEARASVQAKGLIPSIAQMKIAFFAFHNLCELERSIRSMYAEYGGLSERFDTFEANAKFFSYLRNKFAAHLTDDLVDKALEWKPELKMMLAKEYDPKIISVLNLFFLETAINTYVDDQGRHRLFDSETDLLYPPDEKRFRETLLESIDNATGFLEALEQVLQPQVSMPETREEQLDLYIRAGGTDFKYLRKGKR